MCPGQHSSFLIQGKSYYIKGDTMDNTWKKRFFIIYLGQTFSIIGSAAVQFAIIWHLTQQTGSAVTLSAAAIAGYLPGILFGSFAGVYIDRKRKRSIMVMADGGIALSSLVLAIAFLLTEAPASALIYAILFIRGIGTVFHGIAMQAAIPLFVPEAELVRAGGWGQFVNGAGNLIGPALGALLIANMSMEHVMLVDILGAIFAIICLMSVKLHDPKKEYTKGENPAFGAEFRQGFVALRQNIPLFRSLPHYILTGVLYMPVNALFMLLVVSHYGGSELEASYMEIAAGGGVILGSVVIGQFGAMKRKLSVFSASIALGGIFTMITGLLPPSMFWIGVLVVLLLCVLVPFFNVPFGAYAQESVPKEELGRVTSLIYTLCYIGNPLGIAVAGPIGDVIGVDRLFVYIGILLFFNGLICLFRIRGPEQNYVERKKVVGEVS